MNLLCIPPPPSPLALPGVKNNHFLCSSVRLQDFTCRFVSPLFFCQIEFEICSFNPRLSLTCAYVAFFFFFLFERKENRKKEKNELGSNPRRLNYLWCTPTIKKIIIKEKNRPQENTHTHSSRVTGSLYFFF